MQAYLMHIGQKRYFNLFKIRKIWIYRLYLHTDQKF